LVATQHCEYVTKSEDDITSIRSLLREYPANFGFSNHINVIKSESDVIYLFLVKGIPGNLNANSCEYVIKS